MKDTYQNMSAKERMDLFYEQTNTLLLPALAGHINAAVAKLAEISPPEEDECMEMIMVADTQNQLFAFARGDGSELDEDAGPDNESVFYTAREAAFTTCLELLPLFWDMQRNPESAVHDWVTDATSLLCKREDSLLGRYPLRIFALDRYAEDEEGPIYE